MEKERIWRVGRNPMAEEALEVLGIVFDWIVEVRDYPSPDVGELQARLREAGYSYVENGQEVVDQIRTQDLFDYVLKVLKDECGLGSKQAEQTLKTMLDSGIVFGRKDDYEQS